MYLFSLPYLTDTISHHVSGGFANLEIGVSNRPDDSDQT